MIVDLGEAGAAAHYIKDIEDGEGAWRWTGQRPTLKIFVFAKDRLRFSTDFTVWETALQQTGPVELSFFVNDRLLGKVRYAKPGYQHFEKPLPDGCVIPDADNTVGMAIDKLYTAPQDGKKFGVILTRIGFEPQ